MGTAMAAMPAFVPCCAWLAAGAAADADAVIAAAEALDELIAAGRVLRDGRRDFARSATGEVVSAGIAAGAASPAAARELVAFLASPELGPVVERHGLEQPGVGAARRRPLFNGRDLTG